MNKHKKAIELLASWFAENDNLPDDEWVRILRESGLEKTRKHKLTKNDLTTILQSLENEHRITTNADDMTDKDTQDWAREVERVKEIVKEML